MMRWLLAALCCLQLLGTALPVAAQTAAPAWNWAKGLRTPGPPSALATDAQGNTYLAGAFNDSIRLEPGTRFTNATQFSSSYLAKYSAAGGLLWARQLLNGAIGALVTDAAGALYVSGQAFGGTVQLGGLSATVSGPAQACGFLTKLDAQGQGQWLRLVGESAPGTPNVMFIAYTAPSLGASLALDAAGNLYLTGVFSGTVAVGALTLASSAAATSIFLAKFDPQGVPLWVRQGGTAPQGIVSFYNLTVSAAGEAYLLGSPQAQAGTFGTLPLPAAGSPGDVLLVKYDAQGTPQWLRRCTSTGTGARPGQALVDGRGRLVVPLEYSGTLNLGSQTLPGSSLGGRSNGALAVFDASTGALAWVSTFQSPSNAGYCAVATDAAGNLYASGQYLFSATIGTHTLSSAPPVTGVVVGYSPTGTALWVAEIDHALPYLLAIDANRNLRVAGEYSAAPRFGAVVLPQFNFTSSGASQPYSDGQFVARLGALALATRPAQAAQPLALYPNPAHTAVALPPLPAGTRLVVLDALGRAVRTAPAAASLPVAGLAPGLYQVHATAPTGQQWNSRLAVE